MAGFGVWLRGLLGKEGPIPDPSSPHARTRPSGPQSFAEDNNNFALAMYGQLRQRPGNLFFSPFSIRTALGMAQAGARDETAAQMRKALCISSSDESLFLSAVFHKAFVEVNEEGTEAAAATAVGMTWGFLQPPQPPPVPIFRADHPFLFAIRDRKSGTILFLGRISDPTRES